MLWVAGSFACVALIGWWVTIQADNPPAAYIGMMLFGLGIVGTIVSLIVHWL